jgi:signal transduction histidine kinase
MTKAEAFELLQSRNLDDRLRAARFFEKSAAPEDVATLKELRQAETATWIKDSLDRAIAREFFSVPRDVTTLSEDREASYQDLLTRATQEVTSAVVHELEPLIGLLRVSAAEDVPNYEDSKTKERIERLGALAVAVSNLRAASQPPALQEFNLSDAVRSAVIDSGPANVIFAGSAEVSVVGDRGLICIAVGNALRNAIEATPRAERDSSPIVVNWGKTDRDAWISVIDQGIGFQESPEVLMRMGNSTKDGHFGMGLAMAKTALSSLGGNITLSVAAPRGTKFEARWPLGS